MARGARLAGLQSSALQRIHRPTDAQPTCRTAPLPWQRLAYDELLAGQLALALVRQSLKGRARPRGHRRRPHPRGDHRRAALLADAARKRAALDEIEADMAAPQRMLRLLQGDVGSGKTVVALLAMAVAVEAGAQAALMAPTEVLARQHLETIAPLAEAAGLRIAC